MSRVAAIVLAGGRSTRFGSDKLAVALNGTPLVSHAIEAARAFGAEVVVVGPDGPGLPVDVTVVREDPPYSGPYAAVAAGLGAVDPEASIVLVLAGDLVDPGALLPRLVAAVERHGAEAAVALDPSGLRQPLLAAYRLVPLLGGIVGVDPVNRAASELLDGLHVVEVPDDDRRHTRDIDTVEDLAAEIP